MAMKEYSRTQASSSDAVNVDTQDTLFCRGDGLNLMQRMQATYSNHLPANIADIIFM